MSWIIKLETTWLNPVVWEVERVAIAHKIWGDNMSLLWANAEVTKILAENWVTQAFAISAFRSSQENFNTTSHLIQAGESRNQASISETLSIIWDFHQRLLNDILSWESTELQNKLLRYIEELFQEYQNTLEWSNLNTCSTLNDYKLWVWEKVFSLVSIGEVIAAKVFARYLQLKGLPAKYIDIENIKTIKRDRLSQQVEQEIQRRLTDIMKWQTQYIPVFPWYIWGIEWGILGSLGRWYTDYTASRIAVALHDMQLYDKVWLYIQKMYGFKSTDPRIFTWTDNSTSVNTISYWLARRAISHRWAGAGLVNSHSIDERIISRNIPIIVWNPTVTSDKAIIHQNWWLWDWVQLVLWRAYTEHDQWVYGRRNPDIQENHIIYLMWENLWNLRVIFDVSCDILKQAWIIYIAWEMKWNPLGELSFVFKTKDDAHRAQRLLHSHFIEQRNTVL